MLSSKLYSINTGPYTRPALKLLLYFVLLLLYVLFSPYSYIIILTIPEVRLEKLILKFVQRIPHPLVVLLCLRIAGISLQGSFKVVDTIRKIFLEKSLPFIKGKTAQILHIAEHLYISEAGIYQLRINLPTVDTIRYASGLHRLLKNGWRI